jgi:hypothetical protein
MAPRHPRMDVAKRKIPTKMRPIEGDMKKYDGKVVVGIGSQVHPRTSTATSH